MTRPAPPQSDLRESGIEIVKRTSRQLRGTIGEGLAAPDSGFVEDDATLLKFHGIYQQFDRDSATARKQKGLEKEHSFMIRLRVPAGKLTAAQYARLDNLVGQVGDGRLRITTRQTLQFHGVLKDELRSAIGAIDGELLTTFGACGDVVRNVITTPAPLADAVHHRLAADAAMLSGALLPKSRAWHEIWLDGARVDSAAAVADAEPLYGETYLPRKFKIGLAAPEDNSVDVLTNDLAAIALFDGDQLTGYTLALGGGLGMTHGKPATYPRLATPVAFVAPDGLLSAVQAVVRMQRDHGERFNRKHARLKYLVDERGIDWVRAALEADLGHPLAPAPALPSFSVPDHLGWHAQGDGRFWLGVPVPSGRIADSGTCGLRWGLRAAVERFDADPVLTPDQNILLSNLAAEDRLPLKALLRDHGIALADEITPLDRWSLACPALPSCSLALTEAERVREPLVAALAAALTRHGLGEEAIALRITGCANGCARPYSAEIGIVGRVPGAYALYVGGSFEGARLGCRLFDRVPYDELIVRLDALFGYFAAARAPGERFGDFCARHDCDALAAVALEGEAVRALGGVS